jgi:cobalt-precorrin 5A hydrolase
LTRHPWLVAGLGCRQGCPAQALQDLLEQALVEVGATVGDLKGIASLDTKASEAGLLTLAARLGLPLASYPASALVVFEPLLSHRSAVSLRHTGCLGVAESTALAHCQFLSQRPPQLRLHRLCSAQATVALATPA